MKSVLTMINQANSAAKELASDSAPSKLEQARESEYAEALEAGIESLAFLSYSHPHLWNPKASNAFKAILDKHATAKVKKGAKG
jgi:hypothetical protein